MLAQTHLAQMAVSQQGGVVYDTHDVALAL